jgi:hypothetical protein
MAPLWRCLSLRIAEGPSLMLIRYIVLYGCHYVIYGTEGYGIHKNPSFCRWLVVQVEEEVLSGT